jgi:hypothetical protein
MSVSRESGANFIVRRRSHPLPAVHSTATSFHTSSLSGQSKNFMIPPRSSHYERLEGGLRPTRLGVRNIAWNRIVLLCLTVIVGLVWLLSPSQKTIWSIKTPGEPLQTLAGASIIACIDIEGKNYVL